MSLVEYEYITSVAQAEKLIPEMCEGVRSIGFDTETTALDPREGELRLLGFGKLQEGKPDKSYLFDKRKFCRLLKNKPPAL